MLAAWVAGAILGLSAGILRAWIPLAFLLAGVGFAGGLGILVGHEVFSFIESEPTRELAGFFLVFAIMLVVGLFVTRAIWHPMSIATALMSIFLWGVILHRAGGLLLGVLFSTALLSVVLLGLQQYPVPAVLEGLAGSSFASSVVAWVDRYVASLEISEE